MEISRQTRHIGIKVWLQGTAKRVSQAGNIDVVIRISVLHLGSRLVADAHIFTAGLQRWGMEPGSFKHLGTPS